jgi:hypothetical protein
MWSYARGYPGKSGFGSASTAEDVTEGLSLEDYTAIITGTYSILITWKILSMMKPRRE